MRFMLNATGSKQELLVSNKPQEDAAVPSLISKCYHCHGFVFALTESPYFIESLEPMEVTTGDAVCLKCQVAGTPEIKVSWFKADGKVRSSPTCKLEYSKGVACLKLSKATKADIGEYTCKAENKIGSASSTCRLTVLGNILFSFTLQYCMFSLILYDLFWFGSKSNHSLMSL